MTPEERKLIDELFDRLATLEDRPRDPDAARAIAEGLARAPNAIYPLVQTVLVQDEALKRADARIRALEADLGVAASESDRPVGFLDSMRDALFGRREPRGSVPSVPASRVGGGVGTTNTQSRPTQHSPALGASGGGSFLGTAAAAAAGVIGGALLLNSFRGLFGGEQHQQPTLGGFDGPGRPWSPNAGDSDLARQAGIDDIGRSHAAADDRQPAGLFDTAMDDGDDAEPDVGDLGDFDIGDTA